MRFAPPAALAAALALACGAPGGPSPPTDELDARVEVPAADPAWLDFPGGEWVVAPGDDKMFCTHVRYDGEDMAFDDAEPVQAKYGHHAILLAAKEPLPPGTVEDCTDPAAMTKFDAYALPKRLPAGMGVFLPKGKAMVLQSHYVNAGLRPMRVRDYVRFHRVPLADVKRWAAMYATNHSAFQVVPGETKTLRFDCTITQDVDLLLVGGHMHEQGTVFEFAVGGSEADLAKPLYVVDPWRAEFRDTPPVTLLFSKAVALKKGMIARTTCTWRNELSSMLEFPHEMCSAFGYVGGTKETEVCWVR